MRASASAQSFFDAALAEGFRRGLGFGESLGRLIRGEAMPDRIEFEHPEVSILAAGVRLGIPVTIHVGIGTDIIDQHQSFDGAAKAHAPVSGSLA